MITAAICFICKGILNPPSKFGEGSLSSLDTEISDFAKINCKSNQTRVVAVYDRSLRELKEGRPTMILAYRTIILGSLVDNLGTERNPVLPQLHRYLSVFMNDNSCEARKARFLLSTTDWGSPEAPSEGRSLLLDRPGDDVFALSLLFAFIGYGNNGSDLKWVLDVLPKLKATYPSLAMLWCASSYANVASASVHLRDKFGAYHEAISDVDILISKCPKSSRSVALMAAYRQRFQRTISTGAQ